MKRRYLCMSFYYDIERIQYYFLSESMTIGTRVFSVNSFCTATYPSAPSISMMTSWRVLAVSPVSGSPRSTSYISQMIPTRSVPPSIHCVCIFLTSTTLRPLAIRIPPIAWNGISILGCMLNRSAFSQILLMANQIAGGAQALNRRSRVVSGNFISM
jgi:hypothetical protein